MYHDYDGKGGKVSAAIECSPAVLCASREPSDYIDDLWFLLHHAEDGFVLGLTSYLDDSGSDDGSPLVTCGGVLMSRLQFRGFSERWTAMYGRNQFGGNALEQPLHMSDFVGNGKYAGLYPEFKRALFIDVATLINEHKYYSIAVAVSQDDFRSELSEEVRKTLIGPYAFAFFALVAAHQRVSEKLREGPVRTAYLVDRGFGHQQQLNEAHDLIVRFEIALGGPRHTGALATDTDDRVPALQAADVIAWSSRRMELDGKLPEGFEPLETVLEERSRRPHVTIPIPKDGIEMFAEPVVAWISKHGEVPRLVDVVSRLVDGVPVKLKS